MYFISCLILSDSFLQDVTEANRVRFSLLAFKNTLQVTNLVPAAANFPNII